MERGTAVTQSKKGESDSAIVGSAASQNRSMTALLPIMSLVYPGLGVEAVKRAPSQSRGLAMGAYTVYLDVALGFGSPVLGLLAGWTGVASVFLASAILVLGAAVVAGCCCTQHCPRLNYKTDRRSS